MRKIVLSGLIVALLAAGWGPSAEAAHKKITLAATSKEPCRARLTCNSAQPVVHAGIAGACDAIGRLLTRGRTAIRPEAFAFCDCSGFRPVKHAAGNALRKAKAGAVRVVKRLAHPLRRS